MILIFLLFDLIPFIGTLYFISVAVVVMTNLILYASLEM